jgi:hypothetical protein
VESEEAEARKLARYWLNELGIDPDELAKQYPQLAAGRSGRQKHPPVPHWFLAGVELWARVVRQQYNGRDKPTITRKKAIQWFAEGVYLLPPAVAFTAAPRDAKALASYLYNELRRNGINKMPDKKLLPPGCSMKQWAAKTRLPKPPSKYFSV